MWYKIKVQACRFCSLIYLYYVLDLFSSKQTKGVKRKCPPKELKDNKRHKSDHGFAETKEKQFKHSKFQKNKDRSENKYLKTSSKKTFGKTKVQRKGKKAVIGSKVRKGQRHR